MILSCRSSPVFYPPSHLIREIYGIEDHVREICAMKYEYETKRFRNRIGAHVFVEELEG